VFLSKHTRKNIQGSEIGAHLVQRDALLDAGLQGELRALHAQVLAVPLQVVVVDVDSDRRGHVRHVAVTTKTTRLQLQGEGDRDVSGGISSSGGGINSSSNVSSNSSSGISVCSGIGRCVIVEVTFVGSDFAGTRLSSPRNSSCSRFYVREISGKGS
jgi:hypothetical protein